MRNLTVVLSLLAVLGFSMSVLAAAPAYVPVQGYLTDADGAPVDAEVSMTLVLWDSMSGGTPVFSETQQVLVEQGFFTLYLGGAGTPVLDLAIFRDNGSLFIGTKGFITAGEYGGDARLLPAAVMKDYTKPPKTIERIKGQSPYKNWVDGILTGKPCASNFDYAGPLTEVANFGNIALHANGEAVTYDVASMKITSNPALNTLLTKEYRKGWELPC